MTHSIKRRIILACSIATVVAALSPCVFAYGVVEEEAEYRTVRDQRGREVRVPGRIERVISAHGPTTSFLYVTGVQDRLVAAGYLGARDPAGRAAMAVIDPRFPGIMRDGVFSQRNFNVEEAIALDTDLVLTSARSAWVDTVEQFGIAVVLFAAESPDEIIEAMRLTGEIFGPPATDRATRWIERYQSVRADIAAHVSDRRPRVLFTGPDPLQVAGGDMYQSALIEMAGGIAVAAEIPGYWSEVGLEQIALWDPDIVLLPAYSSTSVAELSEREGWRTLRTVSEGRVYRMPKLVAPWDTPTPDSMLALIWLAGLFDPTVDGSQCRAEVVAYYREYYGYEIEDVEPFCSALD